MSRTPIRCPKCKEPIATKHHSGRIVAEGVTVIIVDGQVRLKCTCGGMLVVEHQVSEKQAA